MSNRIEQINAIRQRMGNPPYTREALWREAAKFFTQEELEQLWQSPRRNIIDYVTDAINSHLVTPPVIEISCGRRSYRPEFFAANPESVEYYAFDHYLPMSEDLHRLPNILASFNHLPFSSRSAQTIICTEVLEHAADDQFVVNEISRVLRPGGKLILTLPGQDIPNHSRLPYQVDYRRYTISDITQLLVPSFLVASVQTRQLLDTLEINMFVTASRE